MLGSPGSSPSPFSTATSESGEPPSASRPGHLLSPSGPHPCDRPRLKLAERPPRCRNNNAGGVYKGTGVAGPQGAQRAAPALGILAEEDEEGEDEDEGESGSASFDLDDIPQAFSHFTWSSTDGKLLVCDLQGVWNATDGFMLTDPVLHSLESKARTNHGEPRKHEKRGRERGARGTQGAGGQQVDSFSRASSSFCCSCRQQGLRDLFQDAPVQFAVPAPGPEAVCGQGALEVDSIQSRGRKEGYGAPGYQTGGERPCKL